MRKNKLGNLFFKSALVAGLLVTGTCVTNAKPMVAHAAALEETSDAGNAQADEVSETATAGDAIASENVSATDSVSTDSLARETDQLVSEEVSPETIMEGDSSFVGTTVYNGVDYSKVYNYQYYMQMNPDLASMFGTNTEEGAALAISHFVNCGMNDGRIASPNFDVKSYRNANSDLRSIFGKNYKSYFIHYMNYGSNEGRTATGVSKITNGITSWNGKDYSKVYNFDYYTSHYADVNNIFGDDDTLAIQHFIYCGEKEERVASENFDCKSYANANADLRGYFGTNYALYYDHYSIFGYKEGRQATGVSTLKGAVTIYNGFDYSKVYDFNTYMEKNSDLKAAFGNDDVSALSHFVNCGLKEGRVASNNFEVYSYQKAYSDLRANLGTDVHTYVQHYSAIGYKEGRTATGVSEIINPVTTYNGKDYSKVFDANEYVKYNGNAVSNYGYNDYAMIKHFVEDGMKAGEQGCDEFNVDYYMGNYSDLFNTYVYDMKGYYNHYIDHGAAEDRVANAKTENYVEHTGANNDKYYVIYKLRKAGYTDVMIAGIMGNLQQESGVNSQNVENAYNNGMQRVGLWYYSDENYTYAVDNGYVSRAEFCDQGGTLAKAYTNNGITMFGYGIAQWTTAARKGALYDYAKSTGRSIGDLGMQVEHLINTISTTLKTALRNASDINQATEIFFGYYEFGLGNYRKHQAAGDMYLYVSKRQTYANEIYTNYINK